MVTKSGNLFHIDFGHFLGNTKYFMVKKLSLITHKFYKFNFSFFRA